MKKIRQKFNFKSSIFKHLFLSYVVIIVFFFMAYSVVTISGSAKLNQSQLYQQYNLKLEEVSNAIDMQLLSAKNIVANINSSQYINKIYLNTLTEENILNSYTLSRSLNEIKSIRSAANNINIYDVMVFVNSYNRVYTGSDVIVLTEPYEELQGEEHRLVTTTLNDMLGYNNYEIVFNKEFIIYCDSYSYTAGGNKGMICVLFDKGTIDNLVEKTLGKDIAFQMYYNDELIMGEDIDEGVLFMQNSYVNDDFTYNIRVSEDVFKIGYKPFISLALMFGIASLGFYICVAYKMACRYYSPIEKIENIMDENSNGDDKGEMDAIISGITNLIGERNGYREKMVTITPFARQGMLHGILSGNISADRVKILCDEDYVDLKKMYFIIGVLNVAYVRNDNNPDKDNYKIIKRIIHHIAEGYSDEDTIISCYDKDLYNTYIIINSDVCEKMEDFLYKIHSSLYEQIGMEGYEVTIGADEIKENVNELYDACEKAIMALNGMLAGGRGTVYFYETDVREKKEDYFFPKDICKRLVRDIHDKNTDDIKSIFDEIYNKNIVENDVTPSAILNLIDELHMNIIKCIRDINGLNTVKINIEKFKDAATLDEILAYYYKVLETVAGELKEIVPAKKDMAELDRQIIEYIDSNYNDCNMSLAHMTERFGVSNKYISMLCKNTFGVSYLQYIQDKRIKYAATLLRDSGNTLEQIAKQCGYGNILTFRRNFKSIMGITPSDYRLTDI